MNLSDIIVEGLAEFVTAPLEVAGVGGNAFLKGTRRARAADERKAVFEALSGQSTASVLRNRLPEKFRQLVERATANGPVENVYVPAEQFVTYFQGMDIDPFALIDEMEGVTRDDLEMAIAGGGDLQIPTATYAAKIAGSDHDAFFMENMRFDPDDFTATEAAEFNAKAQDAMAEAWDVAESVRLEQEEYKAVEAEIYDSMVSRLRTAGRSTDVATNEALLYPAFYRVMAERSGLTTQEFLSRYPLPEVAGALPEGIQSKNVDQLSRTLAEARNRKVVKDTRQTLLEFISDYGGINDVGGELKNMGAETVKRGKGKKTLRLARSGFVTGMRDMLGASGGKKHGADDVALAAIEAGFLADDPIANDYRAAMAEGREVPDIGRALWDAIDREMRGEAQYSADQSAPDENAALDSIEEYLSSLGVSLDDTDDAIRQAIEGASAGAEYGQAGDVKAGRFRSWFGDSKVVDANNNPLVVYHGSTEDIEAFDTSKSRDGGLWFTDNVNLANVYGTGGGGNVTPVYLSIKSPAYIDGFITVRKKQGLVGKLLGKEPEIERALTPEERTAKIAELKAQGYDGIIDKRLQTFVTFDPAQIKSVNNGGSFDPSDPRLLFQRNETGARGSIQFPGQGVGNGDTIIRLFENADLSTMVHESGHYFLTVLQDMATKGEVNAQAEITALQTWWRDNAKAVARDGMNVMKDVTLTDADVLAALDVGTTGDLLKDAAIDVGMQEQFARAFEQYLMEGKAPSVELRSAFEKFRAWLISIYQKLSGLNVTVSDEVRNVFDRMLASDAEIAQARQETGDTGPVFATAEEMGLTADEYAAFLKLRAQGEENAKAKLLGEIMAPVRREKEKWFKEEREKVRGEVETEINAYRHYRAIEWMGNRRWLGPDQPEDMPDFRLSKERLTYLYGAGVLKTLPRGKQTVYTVEEGLDPDDAAGWFGFASGDEMVRAMETAVPRKEAIEAETDRVMRERHGDPLNDGSLEAGALDAVHNDKRGQWIAAELKSIVEVAETGIGLTTKEARATARQTLARTKVRDAMNANRFLAAERKAAEEAARLGAQLARDKVWLSAAQRRVAVKARAALRGNGTVEAVEGAINDLNAKFETKTSTFTVGDQDRVSSKGNAFTIPGGERTTTSLGYNDLVARLIETKRRQLLNHSLYMEARNITEEVEKAERFVAKLNKKSTRERIAGAGRRENASVDYLGAIDELLDQYDFRKMGPKAEARRGSLNAFVDAMKAAGRENELAIPENVLARAAMAPYKTLAVEELRGVIDSLKNLEHMALRWNDLLDAQNKRTLDEAVDEVVASFDANISKRPPGRVASKGEEWRNRGRQFLDLVLNAGTILREIDGFADLGAAYRNIKSPIDEAMNRLTVRKEKAAADIEALYEVYSKEDRRRMAVREHQPALGYALSKWERIAAALNTGNEGNMQRLTDPKVKGSMTPAQVDAILATLDERDAKFIQSVWDYINTFRDDIAAREKRATGVEPKWVEASPVVIAGKTLKGGYYPIKYDPRLSSLARDDETQEIAQSLQAGRFGKAQTRNGHLKDRAQSSGRDVELDMSVMHRHVNQVIYDIELSEAVANSWRILQSGGVRSAFTDSGKSADFDALEIWLKDVAEGELKSSDLVGRAARTLKSNFTAAKLALNLGTVALQVTGLSQTMVVVGKKDFVRGLTASFRRGVIGEVTAKSPFMASRQTTFNKDIYDFYADPKDSAAMSRWSDIKRTVIGPASFYLMTKVQFLVVDVPTWMAGYKQGLRKFGNDEAQAVAHADAIVKRAQSSGLFPDRSAIERGSVSRNARQNDVVRLFTALASYMFAKFNVAYERTGKASAVIAREGVSTKSAGEVLSWLVDMGFLFTVEAVLGAAIKGKLPDDEDDEDDTWMKFLARETGLSVMGTIPGVRDVTSFTQGFSSGGSYGGIIADIGNGTVSVAKIIGAAFDEDEDVKKRDVKNIITGTAIATGLPGATQLNRVVDAGWRQAEGEDVSPVEYILGKR